MGMTIIDAEESMIPQLAALEEQCFSMPWTEQQLRSQLPDASHEFIAAVDGGRVLGYVGMMFVLDEGYISNVAVSPECRRQGIGDALIAEMDSRAKRRALSFATLEVRESNAPAIALYSKHGYVPVGTRKNYYDLPRENAILMTNFLQIKRTCTVKILSFESTCDETAVAVVEDGRKLLTDQIFSQADLHAVYGGVVPEIASRCHVESISILAQKAIEAAGITRQDIDAVAVSYAPGLIGAVLVGVNFAKSCALALNVPLIPVHHIRGHIAANYLAYPELEPPFLCLAISGGNTILVDVRGYTDMHILGATRDDAAGECFDKTARVLGLPYPGGKPIDLLSQGGDDTKYHFPISHVEGNPYDMSFSGLKTAVINLVHTAEQKGEEIDRASLAASFTKAVSDSLVPRAMQAAKELGHDKIVVAGGVAANSRIRADFKAAAEKNGLKLYIPPLKLCGDNGAMVGAQAYYEYLAGVRAGSDLNAYATMEL